MKRFVLLALASIANTAAAQAREFRLDGGHSDVAFTIGFLGSTVRGRFDGLSGTLTYDHRAPENSSITMVIDIGTLNSGSRHRDAHLLSDDFFDAARFPVATFQSTSVLRKGNALVVRGPLTMHGVTREVAIPFRALHPPVEDPHGSTLVDFAGTVRVARADFNIMGGEKHNAWFDRLRSATMSDSVDIVLQVSGWDTDFARAKSAGVDAAVARIVQEGVAATVARAHDAVAKNPDAFKDQEWNVDQIGRALAQAGRTQDALAIFKLESELFPNSSSAHAALGAGYDLTGNPITARAEYETALRLDPRNTRALERMGRSSRARGR